MDRRRRVTPPAPTPDEPSVDARLAHVDRLASVASLAAGVAHEINNPLTYVLFNADVLVRELTALTTTMGECYRHLCEELGETRARSLMGEAATHLAESGAGQLTQRARETLQGAERVRAYVADLRSLSQVQRDTLETVHLQDVLASAARLANNEIKYRAKFEQEHAETPVVMANRGHLLQAFLNILVNAAQAIDEGRAEQNRIWIRSWREHELAVVEIGDTGRGIATILVPRVFEPFYSTKPSSLSGGLGLTISRSIIESYGGNISISSVVGEGTRVLVRLPGIPSRQCSKGSSTSRADVGSGTSSLHGRILVVDDDDGVRDWIAALLGQRHMVVTAPSGDDAVSLLRRDSEFDVVLCDLMMGHGGGTDLHVWANSHLPKLARRFIFMSGGVFTQRTEEIIRELPNALLEKPFTSEALDAAISAVLRNRHE